MKRAILKTNKSRNATIRFVSLVMVLLAVTTAPGSFAFVEKLAAQPQLTSTQEPKPTDVHELKLGAPIERELSGGDAHSYRVILTVGQYLKVVVEQKGIDVVARLFGPDGQKLTEVNNDPQEGSEYVFVVAEAAGTYRLEVQSSNKESKAGTYAIKIGELREATSGDRVRMSAQKAFEEANRLRDDKTAESRRQAIKKYEEAVPLFRMVEDRQYEAYTLDNIAGIYYELSENQKALEYYSQALSIYRAIEDRRREAGTLTSIGVSYRRLGEMQKALAHYQEALTLSRALGDHAEEATSLNNIAVVHTRLGEPRRALEYLQQALLLRRQVGDQRLEAYTLGSIGSAYEALGELQKALEYFDQALALLRRGGDPSGQAIMLNNIGAAYSRQGELPKALEHFGKSLPLLRVAGDRFTESATLDNMGQVYYRLSEFQQALQYFDQALEVRRTITHRAGQAITLNNIGVTFTALGEPQRALEYFEQALSLHRQVGNRREEAATLDNIGSIYFSLGELRKAVHYHNESLGLRRVVGDKYGETYALARLGAAYDQLGELQKALEYFDQSLKLSRTVGNRSEEMSRLHDIGSTYSKLREADKAQEYYTEALALSRAMKYQGREAAILLSTAHLQRDRGNVVEARRQVEDALNIIESIRTKVTSQDLRTSYLASKQGYYEFYVDLLMRLHRVQPAGKYDVLAFGANERARARSLLEILTEARADVRQGVDPELLERERTVQQQLSSKSERLTRLLSGKRTPEQETTVRKEVDALLTDYEQVKTQIRIKSPRYAALTQPQPLSLKDIQELLDNDTVLLEYALGEERSYLWAVTRNSIHSFELPKRAEIETAGRRAYALLIARNQNMKFEEAGDRQTRIAKADAEFHQVGSQLSRMLLNPIAKQLKNRRLLIVSDGILQYLPFAALPQPDALLRQSHQRYVPLIASHEVINLPSASTLAVMRKELAGRRPAPKMVAVLADPVFDRTDERVKATQTGVGFQAQNTSTSRAAPGAAVIRSNLTRSVSDLGADGEESVFPLRRLPFTRQEANAVVSFVSPRQYERALDFSANRTTALDPRLGQYRYIHFATHSILNTQHPELSGIVLSLVDQDGKSQDGFLLAHEVYNLRLPAELVVLSGCRTGLGKNIKGEGVVSLARGFMYAGAKRVVVSYWDIGDKSTAELMAHFYKGMLERQRQTPAAALRSAQLSMWRSRRWRAPYYWAGFTLYGEYH